MHLYFSSNIVFANKISPQADPEDSLANNVAVLKLGGVKKINKPAPPAPSVKDIIDLRVDGYMYFAFVTYNYLEIF